MSYHIFIVRVQTQKLLIWTQRTRCSGTGA